jgi:outer membrane lipoprotein-sorting protein
MILMVVGMLLPAAAQADDAALARELLNATDDMHRGESSAGTVTMNVRTSRWERSLTIKAWSLGEEKSLMIIESPAKEKGMATLKVDDNIWNYLPKVDRTMKVQASMMSGSWMGSHFTNDDLVKESRMADDYSFQITSRPADDPEGLYVIECIPKPDAPVVWGKVVVKIRGTDKQPTEITYWDEKGELKRTMTFSDIRDVGGRSIPMRMILRPADKPEEFTEVVYEDIRFDVEIPASTFTVQGLKR